MDSNPDSEEQRKQHLLDQYAGQAMRGLLASPDGITFNVGRYGEQQLSKYIRPQGTAEKAWDIAEAMYAERQKRMKKALASDKGLSEQAGVTN